MACPECGNRQPIEEHHMVFYPSMSRDVAAIKNYDKSKCQMCGHEWNKYQDSVTKVNEK